LNTSILSMIYLGMVYQRAANWNPTGQAEI
jgi:hypothetical protein